MSDEISRLPKQCLISGRGFGQRTVGHVQYVLLDGGAKVISNPETTLKGALDQSIARVLAVEIHSGISAGRMRQMEREEWNCLTKRVHDGDKYARKTGQLVLGPKDGSKIQSKLSR